MADSWLGIVGVGAVVGLLFWFVPILWEFSRLLWFIRYVNFDRIRFGQLLETGGPAALALPLTQKLTETGILLAWKTQRTFAELHSRSAALGDPLGDGAYEMLVGSLESYREAAGLLSERIGILAWNTEYDFPRTMHPSVVRTFRQVRRDWEEFTHYSLFLRKYIEHHTDIRTETT